MDQLQNVINAFFSVIFEDVVKSLSKGQVKRAFKQLKGFFSSSLPLGRTELDIWVSDIVNTYDLPTQDQDSINYTFATMIMHLGPQGARKPKYYFVLSMRAAAAKQLAGSVFQEIKIRQQQLAEQRKAAEATAPQVANGSGQA